MAPGREVEWASAVGAMVAALWVARLRQNYRFLVALWTSRVVKLCSVWGV